MKMTLKLAAAMGAVLMLGACGGGSGGKVTAKKFASACEDNSNMTPEICSCVGKKAMTELDENGRNFVMAGISQDQARADEIRKKMKMEEVMAAGMFMVNAPAACAREMAAGE